MQIVFRTDASVQIGTGHVMRCLTLADALRDEGATCTFVCRAHTGHLINLVNQRGHKSIALTTRQALPSDVPDTSVHHASWLGTDWASDAQETLQALGTKPVDWLIVDHYALDMRWEKTLRPYCQRLMVIDDLADRVHDCDLLLDQNLGRTDKDYQALIPHAATVRIGPKYALLRPEFSAFREESLSRRSSPKFQHLLITMGGVDQNNITGQVLDTLCQCDLPSDFRITVVMGLHAPWLQQVKKVAIKMPWLTQVLVNEPHIAHCMTLSDLCIGAAGGTAWERCSLGLPSLVITMADNQQASAYALEKNGAALIFKNMNDLSALIKDLLISAESVSLLKRISTSAAQVTSGDGTALIVKEMRRLYA